MKTLYYVSEQEQAEDFINIEREYYGFVKNPRLKRMIDQKQIRLVLVDGARASSEDEIRVHLKNYAESKYNDSDKELVVVFYGKPPEISLIHKFDKMKIGRCSRQDAEFWSVYCIGDGPDRDALVPYLMNMPKGEYFEDLDAEMKLFRGQNYIDICFCKRFQLSFKTPIFKPELSSKQFSEVLEAEPNSGFGTSEERILKVLYNSISNSAESFMDLCIEQQEFARSILPKEAWANAERSLNRAIIICGHLVKLLANPNTRDYIDELELDLARYLSKAVTYVENAVETGTDNDRVLADCRNRVLSDLKEFATNSTAFLNKG